MFETANRNAYSFGRYRLDVVRRQLLCDGEAVTITAKAFDTLATLVSQAAKVVSKDELMLAVWPDTVVEENNLIQQISYLRKTFGERAGDHNFIVTVPGRGYSFVAPVRCLSAETTVEVVLQESAESTLTIDFERPRFAALTASIDRGRMYGSSWAILLILAVCLPVAASYLRISSGTHPQSLAVLNFRADGGDEFIGTSISDTLRARLGSVQDITVRPVSLRGDRDIVTAGRELEVDAVLTGSVQRENGQIRVTVEMVDVANERILWGKTFDSAAANIFALQDAIARDVASALGTKFTSRADKDDRKTVTFAFANLRLLPVPPTRFI